MLQGHLPIGKQTFMLTSSINTRKEVAEKLGFGRYVKKMQNVVSLEAIKIHIALQKITVTDK